MLTLTAPSHHLFFSATTCKEYRTLPHSQTKLRHHHSHSLKKEENGTFGGGKKD